MKSKRILYVLLAIILVRVIFMIFEGYSFNEESSLEKIDWYKDDDVKIILSIETENGSAVLYKNMNSGRVGIAKLQNRFNSIWKVKSHIELEFLEQKIPFVVVGEHIRNSEEEDQLTVGFHSNDANMAFLVCGPEDNKIEDRLKGSGLSIQKFREENPQYSIEEIKDGYSMFLQNEYIVSNWNFYVFDKTGNLIATKVAGSGEAKYTNKN
jgi:hypothetical protein